MDENIFFEPELVFSVLKPSSWNFIPPQWSPVQQLKNAPGNEEPWIKYANKPFCCAMQNHDSPIHAYPTLQVTARPQMDHGRQSAESLMEGTIQFLGSQYDDFKIIEKTTSGIIAGCHANILKSRFTLETMQGNDFIQLGILNRTYVVFASRFTFTIGMSSSDDPAYYHEADFISIISSVRVIAPAKSNDESYT